MDDLTPPIKAWSYSAISLYKRCPLAAKLRYVDRLPTLPIDDKHPLKRGELIHKAQEDYISGATDTLHPLLAPWQSEYDEYRQLHQSGDLTVEEEWGFTIDLTPTQWMADNVWLRVKTDIFWLIDKHAAVIEDLKTGKRWGNEVKHNHQGQLYAFAALLMHPTLEAIDVVFRYPDQQHQVVRKTYDKNKAFDQAAKHISRGIELTNALMFPPKPNAQNCKYCDYGKTNGTGDCIYAVEPL